MLPFNCPISLMPPRVPVLTNEGTTYDFVSIAQSLLRETINAELDPITKGVIDTLIYNRSVKGLNDQIMDSYVQLSHTEKLEIALIYTKLNYHYPTLKIHGFSSLAGMETIILGTKIYFAAQQYKMKEVSQLLLNPASDPNHVMADGLTPLLIAVRKGLLGIVQILLIDERVNPNQGMSDGTTPLHFAALKEPSGIFESLLRHKRLNPNQGTTSGDTPLHLAVIKGNQKGVTALLTLEQLDPNQANNLGRTPLWVAVYYGKVGVVKALAADERVSINQATNDGSTPLLTAIRLGHFEIAQALLTHPDSTYKELSIVAQKGYPALVRTLLSDPSVLDYYLDQIIRLPNFMRDTLRKKTTFFEELIKHSDKIWSRLQEPEHFNLQPTEHRRLLSSILDSSTALSDEQHILYTLFSTRILDSSTEACDESYPFYALFNTRKRKRTVSMSQDSATNHILDDIQRYLDKPEPPNLNSPSV